MGQELVAPDLATHEVCAGVVAPHARTRSRIQPRSGPTQASGAPSGTAGPWGRREDQGRSGHVHRAEHRRRTRRPARRGGRSAERADPGEHDAHREQQGALVAVGRRSGARARRPRASAVPNSGSDGYPAPLRSRNTSMPPKSRRATRTAAIATARRATARRAGPGRGRGPRGRGSAAPRALPAEPARAPGELEQRLVEGGRAEVRPQAVGEHELGVGGLPDEEVADPLLAAGADDEVGVRQAARVQRLADRPLVDLVGRDARGGDRPERVDELRPARVVPRDVEVEPGARRGAVEGPSIVGGSPPAARPAAPGA